MAKIYFLYSQVSKTRVHKYNYLCYYEINKLDKEVYIDKGAKKVIQSKTTSNGLVELWEYETGLFRANERYGVQVNDKEVDLKMFTATTNDLQLAKRVYDSY